MRWPDRKIDREESNRVAGEITGRLLDDPHEFFVRIVGRSPQFLLREAVMLQDSMSTPLYGPGTLEAAASKTAYDVIVASIALKIKDGVSER